MKYSRKYLENLSLTFSQNYAILEFGNLTSKKGGEAMEIFWIILLALSIVFLIRTSWLKEMLEKEKEEK